MEGKVVINAAPKPLTEQAWPDGTVPVLTVFCWVYNHKKFIDECIESILMQETSFPVEVIIHDDASNDGTSEIVERYAKKHPRLFQNVMQVENQWSQGKSVMEPLFEKSVGRYIALSHGDDYWTDPRKLQKQVETLLRHPRYSASVHSYDQIVDGTREVCTRTGPSSGELSVVLLLFKNPIATCSVVIRKECFRRHLPPCLATVKMGDWPRWILAALDGAIHWNSDVMSAYRINATSVWASAEQCRQEASIIHCLSHMPNALPIRFHRILAESLGWHAGLFVLRQYTKEALSDVVADLAKMGTIQNKAFKKGFMRAHLDFFTESFSSGNVVSSDSVGSVLSQSAMKLCLSDLLSLGAKDLNSLMATLSIREGNRRFGIGNEKEAAQLYRAALRFNRGSAEALIRYTMCGSGALGKGAKHFATLLRNVVYFGRKRTF